MKKAITSVLFEQVRFKVGGLGYEKGYHERFI